MKERRGRGAAKQKGEASSVQIFVSERVWEEKELNQTKIGTNNCCVCVCA